MLTAAQIAVGDARLTDPAKKLTPTDVTKLVSVFDMFMAELTDKYGYTYREKLEALEDTDPETGQKAAQVAACMAIMEELGFGVARKDGETKYSEKEEYAQYVLIAFSMIYPIPFEWSQYDLRRRRATSRPSQSVSLIRSESSYCSSEFTEREMRRRRRYW